MNRNYQGNRNYSKQNEKGMIKANTNRNNSAKTFMVTEPARQLYEQTVSVRMSGRSGAETVTGAKGVALEILATDLENVKDIYKPGVTTKLTKNPTATQVDAVKMKNGKVIERIQFKDTSSVSGAAKTANQVKAGKYQQTQLRGTTESCKEYAKNADKLGLSKQMHDTGISTNTTTRIGNKHINNPVLTSAQIADVAKASAISAAALTGCMEVAKSIVNGDSIEECANHIVSKGSESAVNAAIGGIAGELVFMGMLGTPLAPAALVGGVLTTVAGGTVASEFTDGMFDGLGEVTEEIVGGVKNVVDDVAFETSMFLDDAVGIISDIGESIGDAMDEVFYNTSTAVENVGDLLSDIGSTVGDTISDVFDTIFGGWW